MIIRDVHDLDIEGITTLYNHYVIHTSISFEEDPVTPAQMAQRVSEVLGKGLPWIVAEKDGKLLGYAYASPWKPRSAYRFTVEPSVYVSKDAVGEGVGSGLYRTLLSGLKEQGIQHAIGVIALPNEASLKLHQSFGFKEAGVFRDIGVKFGQKWSVAYWQLSLQEWN